MKKISVLIMGFILGLTIVLVPQGKASAIIFGPIPGPGGAQANPNNCPEKGFSASFSFSTTTLARGQETSIDMTVVNNSGQGDEFNTIAFGIPESAKIDVREPAEGIGGPSINTGPWQIVYASDGGYKDVVWTTVSDVAQTGYAPIKPCTQETFPIKVFVAADAPLGAINVASVAEKFNSKSEAASQSSAAITSFQIVDGTSTVTTLPRTGVDPSLWAVLGLAILGIPVATRRRK